MFANDALAVFDGVARQVRSFGEGAAFETASGSNKFGGSHVLPQRILPGVTDRISHFSGHSNHRGILEIESGENTYGVKGLERHWVHLLFRTQSVVQIERDYLRSVVGRIQPNDFGVKLRRLGKQIVIGLDE